MDLKIGTKGTFTKTISEHDVYSFAGISGDFNLLHVNEVGAGKTQFKRRIAHGMLVGSLISAVIGTKMPGEGAVYLEQDMKYLAPVYIGDTCTAEVTVNGIINKEKGIYSLDTKVRNQDNQIVIEGFAVIKYCREGG